MRDIAGFLQRSANVLFVPFSQAVKAVSFLYSNVSGPTWVAERKAKRVVGRAYAERLLDAMLLCRPPPRFEVQSVEVIASIGVDQTYAKAAGRTGISSYSAVETVDEQGNAVSRERMTYLNGQFFAAPRALTSLSAQAQQLIRRSGPYTQDFARVLPLLQPQRMDTLMDSLLLRGVALLSGLPRNARDAMRKLLSRPNVDPGGPTYINYMPPRLHRDTKSRADMIDLVAWCEQYCGLIPLILHIIGDGQTCMRLRELKRDNPVLYKHVLIGNGHLHSGAHSQFADVFLWWDALLCCCMICIGKWRFVGGEWRGTVHPNIKDLSHNSCEHTQQGLLPVAVAIVVYLTTVVENPPRALFVANPVLYISLVRSVGGIVLCQFLRHVGMPTIFWQRSTRAEDGKTMDDLHCVREQRSNLET
jgi:hypothetical protein